jgi:hypothetical protein
VGEASGLAVSRRVPGRLWTHNDSGKPVLYALDSKGAVTARVAVTGAATEDWEALAVGPCPAGSCLYLGDIGDNGAARAQIAVYRVPEPAAGEETAAVGDVFRATYPDGRHDAEALLVTSDGTMIIVTKGETGPVGVYRFPAKASPGATAALERLDKAQASEKSKSSERITDGAISPDGQWAVLRTRSSLTFLRTTDLLAGKLEGRNVDLQSLGEPQGEGVALGADHAVYLVSEGGGKGAGTFARFACTPGQ